MAKKASRQYFVVTPDRRHAIHNQYPHAMSQSDALKAISDLEAKTGMTYIMKQDK